MLTLIVSTFSTLVAALTVALQIANPEVVRKVAQLAKTTGLSKAAAVELAVDRLMRESSLTQSRNAQSLAALLLQFDQVPDRPNAFDPLEWDGPGLPR